MEIEAAFVLIIKHYDEFNSCLHRCRVLSAGQRLSLASVVDSANECIVLCFINVARCLSVRAVSVVIMTRKRVCQHFAMFIIQSPTPDNAYGIHVHQMTLYAN